MVSARKNVNALRWRTDAAQTRLARFDEFLGAPAGTLGRRYDQRHLDLFKIGDWIIGRIKPDRITRGLVSPAPTLMALEIRVSEVPETVTGSQPGWRRIFLPYTTLFRSVFKMRGKYSS